MSSFTQNAFSGRQPGFNPFAPPTAPGAPAAPGIAQAMAPTMAQPAPSFAPVASAAAPAPTPAAQAIPSMSAQAWGIYQQAQAAQQAQQAAQQAQAAQPAPAAMANVQTPAAAQPAVTTPASFAMSAEEAYSSNPSFRAYVGAQGIGSDPNAPLGGITGQMENAYSAWKAEQAAQAVQANQLQKNGQNAYGTAGIVNNFSVNTPYMETGYSNAGIQPGQVAALPGQEAAFADFQARFPGYAQVGGLDVGAGAGAKNIRQYVDPGSMIYDPTYGYIAPVTATGHAGKKGETYMQRGGMQALSALAPGILGAGLAAYGAAAPAVSGASGVSSAGGGATSLAGGGVDALGLGGIQATALPTSANAALGNFLGQSLVPTATTVGAPIGGGFSGFLAGLPAAGFASTPDFLGNGLQASVSPNSANAALGDFLGQSLAPTAATVGTPLGGGFEAFLAGLGGATGAASLTPSLMDILSTPTPAPTASLNGGGLQASIMPGTTANEALGSFLNQSLVPTAATTGGVAGTAFPASLASLATPQNWLQRAFGSLYNDPAGTLFNKLDDPETLLRLLGMGGSLASTFLSADAIKDAANKAQATADPFAAQRPAQAQTFNQTLAAGSGSGRAAELTSNPNLITQLPNYQFNMDQGLDAINRKAAATGNLESGNRLLALQKYAQGYAADQYGAEFGRRAQLDDQSYRDWVAKLNASGQASGAYGSPVPAAQLGAAGDNAAIQTTYGGINDVLNQVFNPRVQNQQSIQDALLRQLRQSGTLW